MKNFILCFLLLALSGAASAQETPFEKSGKTQSATYAEVIAFYSALAASHPDKAKLTEAGPSDAGLPVPLFIISADGSFDAAKAKRSGRKILLINNGIHPGEPDGIDASMLFARDLLTEPAYASLLENVTVLIIPMYNIGGALNRGCCYRANQNGPWPQGFRGNTRNLDLNRDFLKCDAAEARTFNKTFSEWDPDVFIDTHVTDGADYPYVMTLIPTQQSKAMPSIAFYMEKMLMPDLYKAMKENGYESAPYVNTIGEIPDSGIADFYDSPRYATGYTSLHHSIGITTETHMLKPFSQRVDATYRFLLSLVKLVSRDKVQITRARSQAAKECQAMQYLPMRWEIDRKAKDILMFKGYKAGFTPGAATGFPTASYDPSQPWEQGIPWFRTYQAKDSAKIPQAYILPQAWHEAAERLRLNGVRMQPLLEAIEITGESYYIDSFETVKSPYEGHYLHYNIRTKSKETKLSFQKGDWVIFTDQPARRYIAEALEPRSEDSYFAWNFFDEILMQKEYFSSWLFEQKAAEILASDPKLKAEWEAEKQKDPDFAASQRKQLDFIYKRSDWYEKSHMRYPVMKLQEVPKLPLGK